MADEPLARDIADRLGLKKHPRSWRGDCPACSYARVFSVRAGDEGRPRLFCANGCGAADLTDAVARMSGGTLKPSARPDADKAEKRERSRQMALRTFAGAMALDSRYAAPARAYLAVRRISGISGCPDLRFRPDCTHPETSRLPALVAMVRDVEGQPLAIHRTYLRPDGSGKANVEPAKASLGPVWGGAVRLTGDKLAQVAPVSSGATCATKLVIAEGIESSAAASIVMGLPAWAALSAGNLARGLNLPDYVRDIVIAADHDLPTKQGRLPGQEAAQAAARRWRAEGRTVQIALPREPGTDFNDVLLRVDADAA